MSAEMTETTVEDRGFDIFASLCPSRSVLRDVTGKWAPLVMIALEEGATRFGELHRQIGGSSERMLSQTLTTLTEDGAVARQLDAAGRPVYTLTECGQALVVHLRGLRDVIYDQLGAGSEAGGAS